uniref:Abnormal spindle-like microcephaly-associated protein ASH domain-containing protein n=2 Tax=Wuchereria bancrofti TaxID=6293 RepID=A0AAF5PTJ7_WUCBA
MMNSSSWEIQEDRFDDVESEMDEKLSVYEDDLYIDDPGIMEHEKLNEVTITNHSPPRLSTIAEESNIVAEGNEIGARKATYVDSIFGPGLRGKLSGENEDVVERSPSFKRGREALNMLQHDQESFCKQQQRIHDDFGVNRPCLEKENSWEPSIHSSLPPSPKICISELAAFNMTDSHLIPTTLSTARKETSQDIESTPPGISSHMRRLKKKNEPKQNFGGPKMSTPKSAETSLRALSINCISSIYPETISPQSIRGMNLKSSGPFPMARRMSMVTEEPSLSSSAIDRVLEKENFDNDDALVEALLQAKTRPRLKLNFPEVIVGKRPETDEQMERSLRRYEGSTDDSNANGHNQMKNVTTRYDRSGITNETKKLKTVRELNLLREISNTAEDLSPSAKTKWKSEARSDCSLRHIDAENQGKFLSCDQSFVYFGFVDVKCRVNRSVRLRNISSKSLNLKLQLHSMSRGYDLLEQDIIVLKPQEIHLVHVIFQPPFGACFQNTLTIRVLNAEHINYSIPLLGSGGVAALRILTQSGLTMLRDGSFVLTAQGVTNISFDVENRGLRDAFVRVVVVNKETKETISGCTIAPSDCVSILHRSKQKFSIEVPSLCGEESNGNSNPSFPFSSLSMPLVAGNTQYYVQLLWGEEAQRRRLKRYENMKCANFAFNGLTFTKCKFINEKECKSTASEDAFYGPYDRDAFELGLRITLISVVDNRLSLLSRNSCLPHKEMYTESVILEPNAALSPRDGNKSVVEDVSTIFTASRVL